MLRACKEFAGPFWPLLASTVIGLGAGCSQGETGAEKQPQPDEATAKDAAVLSAEGMPLGTVRFATSCDPAVQPDLERGLALLHHMTYEQAEAVFNTAAQADPNCAIAYWGEAMTYVHPLWPDTVPDEKLIDGRALLDQALAAQHGSERERAYIAALQSYYGAGDAGSEQERLRRYADGWAAVYQNYEQDPEAKLFYALALLATASMSDQSYATQQAAGALAEEVLAEIPRHPGAHHYIIHSYDSPPLAERALATARSYGSVAPENSHALHMTSHIFTRLGLWEESIDFNRRAAAASSARTSSGAVSLHHLHALDYLAYASLQIADDEAARAVLRQIEAMEPPYQNHSATGYAFAAIPARYALERQDWDAATITSVRRPAGVPWDEYPYLVAIPEFARALGAARRGDSRSAEAAITELSALQAQAAALNIAYDWGIQVAIQKSAAEAWLMYERGSVDEALELMRQAADMESSTEKNPVTPGAVLPARELYGDMLLEMGRYAEAQEQYEAELVRSPNRFNSLFGAGRAAELAGDRQAATAFYGKLLENCAAATGYRVQLGLAREWLEKEVPRS